MYISHDKHMFTSQGLRFTEIATEMLLLITITFYQQFMRVEYDLDKQMAIQVATLTSIALITMINLSMMIFGKIQANKAKKHQA